MVVEILGLCAYLWIIGIVRFAQRGKDDTTRTTQHRTVSRTLNPAIVALALQENEETLKHNVIPAKLPISKGNMVLTSADYAATSISQGGWWPHTYQPKMGLPGLPSLPCFQTENLIYSGGRKVGEDLFCPPSPEKQQWPGRHIPVWSTQAGSKGGCRGLTNAVEEAQLKAATIRCSVPGGVYSLLNWKCSPRCCAASADACADLIWSDPIELQQLDGLHWTALVIHELSWY